MNVLHRWLRGRPSTHRDDLDRIRASWDALGRHDPMWAIVSDPAKRGNLWGRDEFFTSGRTEIGLLLRLLSDLGLAVSYDRALDFGCGLGRLTLALADHFAHVDGVDVSPEMIRQAVHYNTHQSRVQYHLGDNALAFPDRTFDLIYSVLVLQHITVHHQRLYVGEFVRTLKPTGLAIFQTASRANAGFGTQFRSPVDTADGRVTIDMNIFPQDAVVDTVVASDGKVVHALPDKRAGENFDSVLYVVSRATGSEAS